MTVKIPRISRQIRDGNQVLLRVSRTHAISEDWLHQYAPELYAAWRTSPDPKQRDDIAHAIDERFARIEHEPADLATDVLAASSASEQLLTLIDDYEAHLIATGATRWTAATQRAALEQHIQANKLHDSQAVIDLRLRDWAENAAPDLLARWQRQVLATGDLASARTAMDTIAAAKRWSELLRELAPTLCTPTHLGRVSETLELARLSGHNIEASLPTLVVAIEGADLVRELTQRILRTCDGTSTGPPIRTPSQHVRTDHTRHRSSPRH